MKQENLARFSSSSMSGNEMLLDPGEIFAELRSAQRLADMVNNRSKEGLKPITEAHLRQLQHHLNRQKKKLSYLGKVMRTITQDHPNFKFYITTTK
jgi:hypothetical protein